MAILGGGKLILKTFIAFHCESFKPALHYPFSWNQLVAQHNSLKYVGYYTFQLIDDICWISSVFLPRFSFHPERDSFIVIFNELKSLNMYG